MKTLIATILVLFSTSSLFIGSTTVAQAASADCEITNWGWEQKRTTTPVYGTTSCDSGVIGAEFYCDGVYIGNLVGRSIRQGQFNGFAGRKSTCSGALSMSYSIQ